MEHSQILELQTLQIEPSDKSDNLYKLVWMRVEPIDRLTSIKNRPNFNRKVELRVIQLKDGILLSPKYGRQRVILWELKGEIVLLLFDLILLIARF